jgi:hypothetical protein
MDLEDAGILDSDLGRCSLFIIIGNSRKNVLKR